MVTDPPQLTLLTQARARKVPWLQVADTLLSLEAQSLGGPDGRPWVQIAADRSGYTTNQIRRMTRVAQFVRRLVAEGQLKDAEILSSMRFSHLETAMRIHNFEPETALKVFRREWIRPSYPDLLATYQRLRENAPKSYAPMVAGKRAARRFQDTTLELLQKTSFFDLSADQRIGRMSHPSRYANPDFLIVTRQQGRIKQVDGIDCYALAGRSQRDLVMKRVLQVATESTFFKRFWAVFPDPTHANFFYDQAQTLMLWNVGVLVVDVGEHRIADHRPPTGEAVLDRTRLWFEHLPLQVP
jgi:hypothetical protein